MASDPIANYLAALNANVAKGDATEHTHRPALKAFIEAIGPRGVVATNEPVRIACGAPDLGITVASTPIGHIETKDLGTNLDAIEKGKGPDGKQFVRYAQGLPNWILTDYVEFRWFTEGEKRMTARLATFDGNRYKPENAEQTAELIRAFLSRRAASITTAKQLASRLAGIARIINDLTVATFAVEPEDGLLHTWLQGFRSLLIPDLAIDRFADMFAQTVAYGLFAARVHAPNDEQFSRATAAFSLPRTNPFLRKFFSEIAGVDMPETIDWAVDDLVQLLRASDMNAVLKDFPRGGGKEDPVIHFYETFLAAYNPALREKLGVFYTPHPVVDYIVKSVDVLLKSRFGRAAGLADDKTLILDPATGTATFLYSVIEHIYAKFENQKGAWGGYVGTRLLSRLFGFELLMAPYAVAHLKIGMQLEQTGYRFDKDDRLGIYLTNTLDEALKKSEKLFEKWISDEANEAAEIKRDKPILVVLGNPPYSGESANRSRDGEGELTFIGKLIEDYKLVDGEPLRERVLKWLHDDYAKFIRFAQWRLERTGEGIIAYITNNAYLDNPTFPGMRRSLMNTFSEIWIYNLHGSTRRANLAPDGVEDKNVFDIMQGVSILIGVKHRDAKTATKINYADLWGERKFKYDTLLREDVLTTKWHEVTPQSPKYFFIPIETEFKSEYDAGWSMTNIFSLYHSGIITKRDDLAISFTADECFDKVKEFASLSEDAARLRFKLPPDVRDWKVEWAQEDVKASGADRARVIPVLYRPFDVRFTYYTGRSRGFVGWPVEKVTPHMLSGKNIAIVTTRMTKGESFEHALATRHMNEVICLSSKTSNNGFIFPLYLLPAGDTLLENEVRSNFRPEFLKALCAGLGLAPSPDGALPAPLTEGNIAGYIFAILQSRKYRDRYEPHLATDFPKIPMTTSLPLFGQLAALGAELLHAHMLDTVAMDTVTTTFPVVGNNVVETVEYDPTTNRVQINKHQYFGNVQDDCWNFFVGGYRVAEKWLRDRRGRALSYGDIQTYQAMLHAALQINTLASAVDEAIDESGGWPIK